MPECLAMHHLSGKKPGTPGSGMNHAPEGCKDSKIAYQQLTTCGVQLHSGGLWRSVEMSIT